MSELGDYRRLVEKPMIDRYESEIASLHSENERLQDALQQAIDVFDGMNDDEINVELLPRLRAALNKRALAVRGHGQNRDKTREDVECALADKLEARLHRDRHGKINPELGVRIDAGLCGEIFDAVSALRTSAVTSTERTKEAT